MRAFDLAERFQTPVFVVSDLDIGMNDWLCDRLEWDDAYRPDRGKVLGAEELERVEKFHRYLDVDGDGIAARTLPGTHPKGAYFTRGSGHNKLGGYTESSPEYVEVMERLERKLATAAEALPAPEVALGEGAELGVVSIGGCDGAVREAVEMLRGAGVALDYLRVRAFPFGAAVKRFVEGHPRCFVVEQNRDAQLRSLLVLETGVCPDRLVSVRDFGGLPLSADFVVGEVLNHVAGGNA